MMRIFMIIGLLCIAGPACAQSVALDQLTPPLQSEKAQGVANVVSWGTSLFPMVVDVTAQCLLPSSRSKRDCLLAGVRNGGLHASLWAIKKAVHRERPCSPACTSGVDPFGSFPSGHTATPFAARGGPRLAFAIPLGVLTGDARILSNNHWLTDTLGGAALGLAWSYVR